MKVLPGATASGGTFDFWHPRISRRDRGGHMTAPASSASQSPSHLFDTFARAPLAFERGEGAWLYAPEGEAYLDFSSGIAVNSLGHANPVLVAALTGLTSRWAVYRFLEVFS